MLDIIYKGALEKGVHETGTFSLDKRRNIRYNVHTED